MIYYRLPEEVRQSLRDCMQDIKYHPEGDCEIHTVQVLQNAIQHFPNDIDMHIAAVFHDLGKPETRKEVTKPDGTIRIMHIDHESLCDKFIDKYIDLFSDLKPNVDKIRAICKHHMRAHMFLGGTLKKFSKRRAFVEQPFAKDIINFAKFCDTTSF